MNHAGIALPCASLRWPVSISWFISTFTSVESPTTFARIFIGSAMSASAATQRHLDLLRSDLVLAVGLDERVDVGALPHLHARRQRRIGAGGDVEHRRKHVRVFLDQ